VIPIYPHQSIVCQGINIIILKLDDTIKTRIMVKSYQVSSNSFYATHSIFDDSYPFNNTYHINRSITVIILHRNVNTEDMGELRQVCYGAI